MKRILISLIALLYSTNAYADNVSNLMGLGMPGALAAQIDAQYGTAVSASIIPGADNAYDLGSASFGWRDLFVDRNALVGGTLGVTGATAFSANATITSTGASFPRYVVVGTGGATSLFGSTATAGSVGTSTAHPFTLLSNNLTRWSLATDGTLTSDATNGGDLILSKSGSAISIQENSASTACMGAAAPNGTTPVVVTTSCATSGARIFYSRNGAVTNNASISTTTAPNGTSFSFASTNGADTGGASVVWLIVKESA